MDLKNCPTCGCPLVETNLGRKWCPNCFKIIEKSEESTEENPSYFG